MMRSIGIYIHIPFCLQKCLYCDFCSFPDPDGRLTDSYVEALCRRIIAAAPQLVDRCADTVYIGGGTPTLLSIDQLSKILSVLRACVTLTEDCEITCECNPATADREKLTAMRRMGINRLSIGLQSTDPLELKALGRAHTVADFETVFFDARKAGFENISADLMYGIPHQTLDSLTQTLNYLIALAPEHISAYGLKIEKGTPFDRQKEALSLPDEDTEYAMYLLCTERLKQKGYEKYEISNFAKADRVSRHNLRYWLGGDYLGFGVAAHSLFEGERFGNSRDIAAFLRGEDIVVERRRLTEVDRYNEYLMLRMRLTEGIDCADFQHRFGKSAEDALPLLSHLLENRLLCRRNGRICFTDAGFFVSNAILSEWISS